MSSLQRSSLIMLEIPLSELLFFGIDWLGCLMFVNERVSSNMLLYFVKSKNLNLKYLISHLI